MRGLSLSLAALAGGCATLPLSQGPGVEELLADPAARVLWVGAHPDDETLVAPLLARACLALARPCHFLVLTRGEGGRCPFREGCFPSLGAVRAQEMRRVAQAYRATLAHHDFWNAPLPESSFPARPQIFARWRRQRDPVEVVARAVEAFRPTLVFTFDPEHGFTGHPEHQLASRLALAGAQRAAARGAPVPALYFVLKPFWITRLAGSADPREPSELWDTHTPCGPPGRACLDVALGITALHRTQVRDMGRVRALRPQIGALYLRQIDVLAERSFPPDGQ